jgi:type II secretory ATPase GspE/PulE/Tfp pilus assembly ATPase PilB-like protein
MYVSPELGAAISRGARDDEVEQLAAAAGFRRLLQDGLEKAKQGLVTLEDVLAVARTE